MTARRWTLVLGAAVALITLALSSIAPPLATRATDALHDAFMRAQPRTFDPDAPVHIIDIDEVALQTFGQWPWPRSYLARLNDQLFQHGAAVVGYDILFADPDRSSPEQISESWARFGGPQLELPDLPAHDAIFATSIGSGPTVLSFAGAPRGSVPAAKAGIAFTGTRPDAALIGWPGALDNLAALQEPAAGLGLVSLGRGSDGIVRAVPMVSRLGDSLLPSLSAELLRVAQGAGGYVLRTGQGSGEGGKASPVALKIGAFEAPLDGQGRFRVHFAGHYPQRITPAEQVLSVSDHDPALEAAVAGKIVLVGSSAQGLFDIRATPLSDHVPGVTLHAEVLEQILAGQFLARPDWARGTEVLALLALVATLTLVLLRQRPVLSLATAAIAFTLPPAVAWLAFGKGLLLDPLWPMLAVLGLYLPGTTLGILAKERARRAVRDRFAYFLPPALLAQVADDPAGALTPEGADRTLSVMFVDMRGFTTLTENMPPADVVRLVNGFLSTVSEALVAQGATIDKFMGDAVMAFWNAPIETPDHATRACTAVPAVTRAVDQANLMLERQGQPPVQVSIGLNTGPCQVGLMGSQNRLSYTCIGDSVTLAARLEGLTRLYGVGNCAGPDSIGDLPTGLIAPQLDLVTVKGRSAPIPVHSIAPATPETRALCHRLAQARAAFLARNWDTAELAFAALATQALDGWPLDRLAALYLSRIQTCRTTPPGPDWTGAHTARDKR
ncbi:CHASE2 domain-containing protein [Aliiroseovarius sp.]|uniref:CHASE2 domain-containing protein n=1 Tax=Aliiroseovarius sp. TaxID=1872442 RepID=UPI003BAAEEBA